MTDSYASEILSNSLKQDPPRQPVHDVILWLANIPRKKPDVPLPDHISTVKPKATEAMRVLHEAASDPKDSHHGEARGQLRDISAFKRTLVMTGRISALDPEIEEVLQEVEYLKQLNSLRQESEATAMRLSQEINAVVESLTVKKLNAQA